MNYRKFWKEQKPLFLSLHGIAFIVIFGIFLIGQKPIVCQYKNQWYFPAFQTDSHSGSTLKADLNTLAQSDFKLLSYEFVIWPLFYRDATRLQAQDAWLRPGSRGSDHSFYVWGTYDLGRDLFAACISGLKRSLWLSVCTMLLAGFTGMILGSIVVFQAQRIPSISRISIVLIILSLMEFIFLIFLAVEWRSINTLFIFLFFLWLMTTVASLLFMSQKPKLLFSADRICLAYVEIMKSIPALLFLLILIQIFLHPNMGVLSVVLAFLYTPIVVKYSRAITYKIISEPFLDALEVSGAKPMRIYFRHILPKVGLDLIPVFVFGLANIILLESTLSFLGLGLPLEAISLGNIMHISSSNPSAWWAVSFPGLLVFWVVYTLNRFGEWLSGRKDNYVMLEGTTTSNN